MGMTIDESLEWLISRKEHYEMDDNCQELAQALDTAIETMRKYQKLEQEPRWIPVSERLPESDEEYHTFLVTDSKGRVTLSEFYLSVSDRKPYWSGMIEVIAWMPLPKQYEPQESEDKE